MGSEAGTIDCHVFIECKDQIEKMLLRLYKIDNTEYILDQLQSVYQQIDGMHELKKIKRKKVWWMEHKLNKYIHNLWIARILIYKE